MLVTCFKRSCYKYQVFVIRQHHSCECQGQQETQCTISNPLRRFRLTDAHRLHCPSLAAVFLAVANVNDLSTGRASDRENPLHPLVYGGYYLWSGIKLRGLPGPQPESSCSSYAMLRVLTRYSSQMETVSGMQLGNG